MQKGFSLVEMLVSIAIITIISAVGIQAFAAAQQRARLEEDVAKVVQAIRKAQNNALAPSKSETGTDNSSEKLCSMGIRIDGNEIKFFYTIVNTSTCSSSPIYYGNTTKLNYTTIDPASITLGFLIPFADSSGSNQPSSNQPIKLSLGTISKSITVTSAGLIKVE
jgi:prepilin-type N-terminal cleavage/methylation domain-containing protein